jgi:hypothetical protein
MSFLDSESAVHILLGTSLYARSDAVVLDTPTRRRSKSTDEWKELGSAGGDAMQMGVVGARSVKKNY